MVDTQYILVDSNKYTKTFHVGGRFSLSCSQTGAI